MNGTTSICFTQVNLILIPSEPFPAEVPSYLSTQVSTLLSLLWWMVYRPREELAWINHLYVNFQLHFILETFSEFYNIYIARISLWLPFFPDFAFFVGNFQHLNVVYLSAILIMPSNTWGFYGISSFFFFEVKFLKIFWSFQFFNSKHLKYF